MRRLFLFRAHSVRIPLVDKFECTEGQDLDKFYFDLYV